MENMKKDMQIGRLRNGKIKILEFAVILLIFAVHSWGFWYYNGITVLRDEFGYWEHAASMAGYDWSGAMISAPWYSFGYSLLLLPLFSLCNKMSQMYHLAILLNGVMMVGIYALVKCLMGKFCRESKESSRIFAAALVCLYSGYIAQSKVAWAETAIYLSFWLVLWCMANMIETRRVRWSIAVSVMAGISYTCHNRMLIVMLAVVMLTILMKLHKQLSWKNVVGLLLPLFVIYLWNNWMRGMLQVQMQTNKELEYGLNDIAGRIWRVKEFFTKEGFIHWLRCAVGELLYVYLSTFTIGVMGLIHAGKQLAAAVKKKDGQKYFYIFILLVFLGEWALSALVNMPIGDEIAQKPLTYLYYGRYEDGVIGIFLLMGILYMRSSKGKRLVCETLGMNAAALTAAILTYQYSLQFLQEEMNFVCVPGIWYLDRTPQLNVVMVSLMIGIVAQTIAVLYAYFNSSSRGLYTAGIIVAILFLTVGISYSICCIGYVRSYKQEVFVWAEEHIGDQEVYCLTDENTRFFVQAQLTGHKIRLITEEDVPYLGENCFLITMRGEYAQDLNLCISSEMYYVLVTDGEAYEELAAKGLVEEVE